MADTVPEIRWRRVKNLDPSYSLEVRDPKFRPRFTKRQGETDVRGWRPLATAWWVGEECGGWRVKLESEGVGPGRTYGLLPVAMRWTEKRLGLLRERDPQGVLSRVGAA